MKKVSLSEISENLSRYLRMAEEIIITRHGKPAGVLIGFADEDEWLEYRPRFLERIAAARKSIEQGKGVKLEDLDD